MHTALVTIEDLGSTNSQFGWVLGQIEKSLQKHPEIIFLSKNVLLIPSPLFLLATSVIDAHCRDFPAQAEQHFGYKCLLLEEEPQWICSTEILQKQAPQ